MSDSGADKISRSAVAMVRADGRLRAVELREKEAGRFEVLWARTSEQGAEWRSFASECGIEISEDTEQEDRKLYIGFDASGVGFYRLSVPSVSEAETKAMVQIQAESKLPLPADQMELAWRKGPAAEGQVPITLAAARSELLRGFADEVRDIRPERILLDSEAVVRVWLSLFGGGPGRAVVVNMAAGGAQVCLVENGRLCDSVVVDTGLADLAADDEETLSGERFAQDMRSVMEMFGCGADSSARLYVLSDGGDLLKYAVSRLKEGGLDAAEALPSASTGNVDAKLTNEDFYAYRVAIGLSLTVLDKKGDALNLFSGVYAPQVKKERRTLLNSPVLAAVLAAIMGVALMATTYIVDMKTPEAMEARMAAATTDVSVDQMRERVQMLKRVARLRPDLLELIDEINESGPRGMRLDALTYKRGQVVTVQGEASNADQIYQFQKSLLEKNMFKNVKIQSTAPQQKGNKVKFTVGLEYRGFSD